MSRSTPLAALVCCLTLTTAVRAAQDPAAQIPFREVGVFAAKLVCFSLDAAGKTAYAIDAEGRAYAWDLARF